MNGYWVLRLHDPIAIISLVRLLRSSVRLVLERQVHLALDGDTPFCPPLFLLAVTGLSLL